MSFFETLDEDKLLKQVLPLIFEALDQWLSGVPTDENALMNQVTSKLVTKRTRRCDIGINDPFYVNIQLHGLHRRGSNQTDKYGSDLAVTISADSNPRLTKTAFFQFKIANEGKAKIEIDQISQSRAFKEVYERAFVFAVDKDKSLLRVQAIEKIRSPDTDQKTTTEYISKWESFTTWLIEWLKCNRGKESKEGDRITIETLLAQFRLDTGWRDRTDQWELPEEYLPARSWLTININKDKEG